MMIKQDDGTEVEVFTKEELEAKATEAINTKVEELEAEKLTLLTAKEEELAAAQEELTKLKDKEFNFNKTARGKDKKDAEESGLKQTVEELQKQITAITSAPIAEAKDEFIKNNLSGKKELQDKFDILYSKLSAGVKTKAEAQAAMEQAFILASDGQKPNISGRMMAGSVDDDFAGTQEKAESDVSREFGVKMGVSEEDKKTYGPGSKLDLIKPNVKAK